MKPVNRTAPLRPWLTYQTSGLEAWAIFRKSVLFTITLAFTLSPLCRAQSQQPSIDSFIEVVRAEMQADRATITGTEMALTDKDAAAFWPIYRQYEHERSALDDGRVLVIKEYAEKYPTLTDADASAIANVHSWYGITRVRVAPDIKAVDVEYDASRLSEKDVEETLVRFGIPIRRKAAI